MRLFRLFWIPAALFFLGACESEIVEPAPLPPEPGVPEKFYLPDQVFGFDLHALGIGEMDLDSIPGDTLYYIEPLSSAVRNTRDLDLKKRNADINAPGFILSPTKLTDLEGLQFFINLESMALASNNITNLPLDSLAQLVTLTMSFNNVKDLVVTGNPLLETLQYTGSGQADPATEKIVTIDLTQNPALRVLSLPNHQIVSIDVSQNTALEEINLEGNPGPDGDPDTPDIGIDEAIYDQIAPEKRLGVKRGVDPLPPRDDRFYLPDQIFGFDLHALGIALEDNDSIPGTTLYYIEPESEAVTSVTDLDLKKRNADINDPGFILSPEKLTDLDGLQYFSGLETMSLTSNLITKLPLQGNPELRELSMTFNRVKDLDVTNNPALEVLNYGASSQADPATEEIETIDLYQNTSLRVLVLTNHQIVNIDVSNNTMLEEIDLSGNPGPDGDPETGDIPIAAAIYDQIEPDKRNGVVREEDGLPGNAFVLPDQIFGYDLFQLGLAERAEDMSGNVTYYILTDDADVASTTLLDLKKRQADIDDPGFILSPEKLTDLDGLQYFQSLEEISLTSNEITNMDLSNNTELVILSMSFNFMGELDLSNNTKLETLLYRASGNATDEQKLTSLDVTSNTALTTLELRNHNLVTLDLSNNTALEKLDLRGNPGPDGNGVVIPAAIYDSIADIQGAVRGE